MLGNNAGGFPHAFLGTGSPMGIGIGTIHLRGVWGHLGQSDFSPAGRNLDERLFSSAIVVFSPRGLEGLEMGFSRIFHLPWREGGPNGDDLLRPLEGLLKSDLSETGEAGDTVKAIPENQLAGVFARWALPSSGVEIYLELSREDHAWNLRDLLVEPDHDRRITLGVAKVWRESASKWWMVRGEWVNARRTHLKEVRYQVHPYVHKRVKQGHTHLGQILGSPAAFGGAGAYLEMSRYSPGGRWRVWGERVERNRGGSPSGAWVVDAQWNLGASLLRFHGPWELRGGLVGTWELNRDLESDAWNLRLDLGVGYAFDLR
jgi:hypothetical protein